MLAHVDLNIISKNRFEIMGGAKIGDYCLIINANNNTEINQTWANIRKKLGSSKYLFKKINLTLKKRSYLEKYEQYIIARTQQTVLIS